VCHTDVRNAIIRLLPSLKKEHEWLSEVPSQVLQQAALNLSSAFLNFFEGRTKYPNFKKKQNRQSIRFPQHCKLKDDVLVLPKIGEVYCKVSRQPEGSLKSVTVSVNPSGEYFASCLYDDGQDLPQKLTLSEAEGSSEGKAVGIDVGLTHFAITSDGTKHGNPKYYRKYEQRLARRQKKLSRKQKGSNNRNKARVKVAKVHSKIVRCREDFLHKLSRKLVDENQVIVVENLAVRNMVKNQKLAKSISDAGIRSWQCPKCGETHDRDINAAKNIRDEGLRILAVGHTATASGGRVRPSKGTAFARHLPVNEESLA